MKFTEGKIGRVFILRLEDGDKIPSCIENFAVEKNILHGQVSMIGCIKSGDIVTGPYDTFEMPPNPIKLPIDGVHETIATGILAPNENGNPILHIHGSLGRAGKAITGCLREGSEIWLVAEVVIYEILGVSSKRVLDSKSGFVLLDC